MLHLSVQSMLILIRHFFCAKENKQETKNEVFLYSVTSQVRNLVTGTMSYQISLIKDRKIKKQSCFFLLVKLQEKISNTSKTKQTGMLRLLNTYEPRREKTGLRDFRPGPTQTDLYSLRKELEA